MRTTRVLQTLSGEGIVSWRETIADAAGLEPYQRVPVCLSFKATEDVFVPIYSGPPLANPRRVWSARLPEGLIPVYWDDGQSFDGRGLTERFGINATATASIPDFEQRGVPAGGVLGATLATGSSYAIVCCRRTNAVPERSRKTNTVPERSRGKRPRRNRVRRIW